MFLIKSVCDRYDKENIDSTELQWQLATCGMDVEICFRELVDPMPRHIYGFLRVLLPVGVRTHNSPRYDQSSPIPLLRIFSCETRR